MCLQELDAQAGHEMTFQDISARRNIPMAECASVIERLRAAGIVELSSSKRVVLKRPVEQLTALDILHSVWTRVSSPGSRTLIGTTTALRTTMAYLKGHGVAAING
jgi:DNA-binding IscR family transcriptional regulator